MHRSIFSSIVIGAFVFTLCVSVPVCVAESSIKNTLPPRSCTEDWIIEDNVKLHTKETLFDHINGEAELYFPYGFDVLATATYLNRENSALAIVADVYRMGSLLDAFGIYSNYRRTDAIAIMIGAEGFLSSSQLMFYQDKYFVRLQATGTTSLEQNTFMACGLAISKNLPPNAGRPGELEMLRIPDVVPKSERYIAQSLLGYAFFRRGITADALFEGERMQVFVVLEDSQDAARKAFDHYRSYLKASGQGIHLTESSNGISLTANDPLYRGVLMEQSGRYIIGVVRVKNTSATKQLIEQLRRNLRGG